MEGITTTVDQITSQQSCSVATPHPSDSSSSNRSSIRSNDRHVGHIPLLSVFELHTPRAAGSDLFLPPPIALLAPGRRQDPAVTRLQAALAHGDSTTNDDDSVQVLQPSSPRTTVAASSPRNSLSLGYDDDAPSSDQSISCGGSRGCFFRNTKSYTASTQYSPGSFVSRDDDNDNDEEDDAMTASTSAVLPSGFNMGNNCYKSCYWLSEQTEERQEWQSREEIINMPQTSVFSRHTLLHVPQNADTSFGDSSICGRGVSAATAAGYTTEGQADAGDEVEDEEVDVLSHHDDDEVMGVTAEGEFIYRRDVAADLGRQRCASLCHFPEHYRAERNDGDVEQPIFPTAPQMPTESTLFCTPERSVFTTVLSSATQLQQQQRDGLAVVAASAGTTQSPSPTPACTTIPVWRGRVGSSSSSSNNKSGNTTAWNRSDVEFCSLLLRYRNRENTEELEHRELVEAVDEWRDTQRRYPVEALERRQQEQEMHGLPPLVLRW